tara:strand:- start:86 stop:1120 length:1035 start_codon:yes stop_codon:yes gene_type:complete
MSNLRLFLLLLIIPLVFFPFVFFLAKSAEYRLGIFWDVVSFTIVFVTAFSVYCASANNKIYMNSRSIELKFNFLKESFLYSAFMGTTLGFVGLWAATGGSEEGGYIWMMLGHSIAIALLTDAYGIGYYFSSTLLQNILEKKSDLQDKVTSKYHSNTSLSFILLIMPLIIYALCIFLLSSNPDIDFDYIFTIYRNIIISFLLIFFVIGSLLVGSNFKIVIKSYFNISLEVNELIATINDLKKLSRLMSIVTGIITIFCLVVGGWLFTSEDLDINRAFELIPLIFSISIVCILYIRTFIFRLNLELVELNHMQIDSDKYFIFKYCLPTYIVIQIVNGFGFLIMIFK